MNECFKLSNDSLWWEHTYGPMTTIEAIVNEIRDGEIGVIVRVDENMAYRREFRQAVYRRISGEVNCNIRKADLDCAQLTREGKSLARGLIELLSNGDEPIYMRNETESDHVVKHGLLANKLLWIKGIGTETEHKCALKLAGELCKKRSACGGYILIETPFNTDIGTVKNTAAIDTTEIIHPIDMESFALHYYRSRCGKDAGSFLLSRYVGLVASCVCGTDAEIAAAMIDTADFINDDLVDVLKRIVAGGSINELRGSVAGSGRQAHPLYLLKTGREDAIRRSVWKAQLQVFFPVIEEQRWYFIDKYGEQLKDILEKETVYDVNGRTRVTNVSDLDIGQLYFCFTKDKSSFSSDDFDAISFLRDARNSIAHLDLLKPTEISRLIAVA